MNILIISIHKPLDNLSQVHINDFNRKSLYLMDLDQTYHSTSLERLPFWTYFYFWSETFLNLWSYIENLFAKWAKWYFKIVGPFIFCNTLWNTSWVFRCWSLQSILHLILLLLSKTQLIVVTCVWSDFLLAYLYSWCSL